MPLVRNKLQQLLDCSTMSFRLMCQCAVPLILPVNGHADWLLPSLQHNCGITYVHGMMSCHICM